MRRASAIGVVAGLLLALVAIVATPAPAGAEITAVSPASRDVDPGGSTTAAVSVSAGGFTCISASGSQADLAPTLSPQCSDAARWSSILTVQVPNQPGTYSVRIRDDNFGGREGTFTLRVRTPPPPPTTTTTAPPPPPTTTTTRPPTTTTAPPPTTTTTAAATTTTQAPTTVPESTTTTLPAGAPGDPFRPVSQLLEQPLPAEGIFLPLLGAEFRSCLPLTAPCSDDGSGLALVPARTSELLWQPLPDENLPAPRSDLRGVQPIPAVGVGPPDPTEQQYVLSMLDLTAPAPTVRSLIRSLDAKGQLVFALGDGPRHQAVLQGPDAEVQTGASPPTQPPFGRPTVVRGASFTEAAPVIPMFAGSTAQVVYAVRADVAWGLNLELLPLLGDSLPFLARRVDGPPGLFFARPAGLRVPAAGEPAGAVSATPDDDESSNLGPILLLASAVTIGVGAIGGAALIRRRRREDDDDLDLYDDEEEAAPAPAARNAPLDDDHGEPAPGPDVYDDEDGGYPDADDPDAGYVVPDEEPTIEPYDPGSDDIFGNK